MKCHRRLRMVMSMLLVATATLMCFTLQAEADGRATGNRIPINCFGYVYSPCRHHQSEGGEDYSHTSWWGEFYFTTEYIDETVPATSTPNCRMAYLANSAGLKFVSTHGNETEMLAETFSTGEYADDAVDAYKDDDWKYYDDYETEYEFQEGYFWDYWGLIIHTRGMQNHLKSANDGCLTLSFVSACDSYYWASAWGGREYFGYDAESSSSQSAHDSGLLWDYMTGIKDSGNSRSAAAAYAKGTPHHATDPDKFRAGTGVLRHASSASGKTTLSPVVVDYFPKTLVCDDCTGWVLFDTYMLTYYTSDVVTVDGDATLSNFVWNGTHDALYFDISDTQPNEHYTFTIHWNKAFAYGSNYLNGNQDPAGSDGTRPNKDNFVWTVTGDAMTCDPTFVQYDRRDLVRLEKAKREYSERVKLQRQRK